MSDLDPESIVAENTDRPKRSKDHYWDFLIFQVEDELYKVPRYRFELESPIFKTASSLPDGGNVEGITDEAPIRLEGISKTDFSDFLKVLYPLPSNDNLSQDQWLAVLKLSSLWEFNEVKKKSISQLRTKNLRHTELIQYGMKYSVAHWLREGLMRYANAIQDASDNNARAIGYDIAYRCAKARIAADTKTVKSMTVSDSDVIHDSFQYSPRDFFQSLPQRSYSSTPGDNSQTLASTEALRKAINEEFAIELKDLEVDDVAERRPSFPPSLPLPNETPIMRLIIGNRSDQNLRGTRPSRGRGGRRT